LRGDEPRDQAPAATQGQLTEDGAPKASRRPAPSPNAPREPRTKPKQFVREVKGELRKVAWPTRAETLSLSLVVFVFLVMHHRTHRRPGLRLLEGGPVHRRSVIVAPVARFPHPPGVAPMTFYDNPDQTEVSDPKRAMR
jgi:preprotein translocase subunit SecE